MLRTNPTFLQFIQNLFASNQHHEAFALRTWPKGSLLLKQGTAAVKVSVIREGITKCYFSEENGKDFIIEFLSEGEILGDLEAIRNNACLCNVEALTNVQVYSINIDYFRTLLQKDLMLNQLLLDALAGRVINTSQRSSLQQLYTVDHAVKRLLELQTRQQLDFSKEDMAAYLGITLRSLNRALKHISEQE
ncbi:Crp/Fnr family transcriptional regulator [Pseudoflavitalea rhizosphaerae]|uniref:Crp/Fnr family transcriptional regulator n=1 Tax=Pseudoflavitalea rhizosphaerae TaxID=1884793 RepID=UPI000F8D904E|nr:Crp/Fnr family transcriptional regulator [Pseudoflavitalea rhizosphaerae]